MTCGVYANQDDILNPLGASQASVNNDLIAERNKFNKEVLMCHLNINSIQNKFEELASLIKKSRTQLMIISKSKIDSSYPNSQFTISGYELHRNDRKKGEGGILAYVSSELICKRIKPVKNYKTIEVIVLDIQLKTKSIIVIGLYRPPKSFTLLYREELEEELNHICNWANQQRQSIVLLGDLNLDRLRPTSNEGKLLLDLQETHELDCLIFKPTRVQKIGERVSETLIDVILTNLPDGFIKSGVFDPGLSDHSLVYAFMKEKVVKFKTKVVNFRSCKNLDEQVYRDHLASAPWHVAGVFDDVDDQSEFFSLLLKDIVDEHMPWKRMRVRDGDVPYMTTEWKETIRRRRKALRRFHKTKAPEDWELQRKLRNEATRLRRKAIKDYWNAKSAISETSHTSSTELSCLFLDLKR